MPNTFGYDGQTWDDAVGEVRVALVERAQVRGFISYSELAGGIQTMDVDPHSPVLWELLGDVSTAEDAAGRGMLSVIVVHKDGDMQPGPGFFELSRRLGRDTVNIERCWVDEFKRVHREWSDESK